MKQQLDKLDNFFLQKSQSKIGESQLSNPSQNRIPTQEREISPLKQKQLTNSNYDFFKQQQKHRKKNYQTRTKWDTFEPYAFTKLSQNRKAQTFLDLFDEYRQTKNNLNQEKNHSTMLTSKVHHLQDEVHKLKMKSKLPAHQRISAEKESNLQNRQLKEEVKRLHQKIVSLTGNKFKFNANKRPQSANKTQQKIIFPVNQNIKAELELQRRQVKELLLVIDELKSNKYYMENRLKQKNDNSSLVRQQRNPVKKGAKPSSDSQFDEFAYDLSQWKQKYHDLEVCFNKMNTQANKKIKSLEMDNLQLRQDERMKKTGNGMGKVNEVQINILQEKNRDLQNQRERLETELRKMINMPFNQNNRTEIQLQQKYGKLQLAYTKIKTEFQKTREKSNQYFTELQYKTRQSNMLKTDNEKLKKQIKETFKKQNISTSSDSNEIDYNDYYRKLMGLVKLEGDDPAWRKYSNMVSPTFNTMEQEELQKNCNNLWRDKLQLLAHLQKAQIQLKTFKQSNQSRIGLYIKDKEYLEEQLRIARSRLDEWASMQKMSSKRQVRIFEWAGIKYDDSISVFEAQEQEVKELQATHNFFDLYLGQLNLDEGSLLKNPQNKIKSIPQMISFLTVDFYNHDTQHSNFLQGNAKKFNNNYSFKIQSNPYFIKYLTKNVLTIELWSPQGTSTILIGKGQIWLKDLLSNSIKDISAVIRGKCPIYYMEKLLIGTVQYRMRMRLPIGSLSEWSHKQETSKNQKQSLDLIRPSQRKKLSISIPRATNLPASCNAFVYFTIQNQDYFSQPSAGPSAYWDFYTNIDVLVNDQFMDELRQKYVQFTIFDDLQDINQDIIGIAKANLTPLVDSTSQLDLQVQIRNRGHDIVGMLNVKVGWVN